MTHHLNWIQVVLRGIENLKVSWRFGVCSAVFIECRMQKGDISGQMSRALTSV